MSQERDEKWGDDKWTVRSEKEGEYGEHLYHSECKNETDRECIYCVFEEPKPTEGNYDEEPKTG
jgi:hypothetical protein